MKRTYACACWIISVLLVLAELSAAQVATGTPNFGSFGGGPFDTVNLGNLNSRFSISIMSKAGRGKPFRYSLTNDSSIWTPEVVSGSTVWQPLANWGWQRQNEVALGYITNSTKTIKCLVDIGPPKVYEYDDVNYQYVYHDTFDTAHSFNGTYGNCGPQSGWGFNAYASDGSGYKIVVDYQGSVTIYSRDGTVITPPYSSSGAGAKTDSNGNQISVNSNSQFFDTLSSTTPVLTITGSGTPASPFKYQYTAPSGGTATYTANYTQYTVKTNFRVTGISEYGPLSNALVTSITLPDGTSYSFTYEQTPGSCTPLSGTYSGHCVTGRLTSVTTPTGGTINYTYATTGGTSNTGIFSDGSLAGLTRQLNPGGEWQYTRSQVSGTHWQTVITSPPDSANQGSASDVSIVDFQQDSNTSSYDFYETQRLAYQGASTLLKTTINCYNGNGVASPSTCSTVTVTSPITRKTTFQYLPDSNGKQSETDVQYNSYGLITAINEYDYGNGAVGSLLRQTVTAYATLGNGIVDRPSGETVLDGSSNTESVISYSYDENPLQSTSGLPNHVSVTGSRGNLTSSYSNTGSTNLGLHFQYYDTGAMYESQDVNGAWTTYVYGSNSCNGAFPTQVNAPLGLSSSTSWNCTGGVATSSTDVNGKTSTVTYSDSYYWRPASTTDQALNATNFSYASPTAVESYQKFNNNASITDQLTTLDGLGRIILSQQEQAPSSSTYDSSQITYDTFGRLYQATMSYVGASGQAGPGGTPIGNTASYDALDRVTQNKDGGGGYITYGYTRNDVLLSLGPAPVGENTKQRQLEYDAIGRLTSVCEITAGTASFPGGTCNQSSAQTGYWTTYAYDTTRVNSIPYTRVKITGNAQGTQPQTRTYLFDLVGRLTSEINPENGTTTYTYDSGTGCSTMCPGNLIQRTDNKGNTTSYTYDALHRITSISYSGPDSGTTPNKYFVYDAATVNNISMTNAVGRMAEAYTGSANSKATDVGFSYSVRGELTDVYESTPNSHGYYHVGETFWPNGTLASLNSNVTGLPNQTYGVDGKGRISSITAASGQNPVTSALYDPVANQTTVTFGSLDSDVFTFDPNTGRLVQYLNNVGNKSVSGKLGWNANGTLQTLQITDGLNSLNTQTCSVGYDDLVRAASVNCGTSIWNQNFTYDPFGNIQKSVPVGSTGITFLPGYSTGTNQFASLPGATPTYDSNGNLTYDGTYNYAWDAEGKMLSVNTNSVQVTYDALGRMVEQNRSGSYTQIVYAPTGRKFALMSGQTLVKALVPLPAGAVAVYTSSGLAYYRHSDWLGSSRLDTTPSRTLYGSVAYAPFGESYAKSGTPDLSFTGQDQDTISGIHDFLHRRYNPVQGRWLTPDPAGLGASNFADPQTFNRYAYVRNNPLASVDPLGLCDDGSDCDDDSGGGGDGGGGDSGGSGDSSGDNGSGDNGTGNNGDGNNNGDNSGDQPPDINIPAGPMPDLGPINPAMPTLVVSETVNVTDSLPEPVGVQSSTISNVTLTGPAGQVGGALQKLQRILPLDPKCLQFLGSAGTNPLKRIADILNNNLYGITTIQPTANPNGGLTMNNGDFSLLPNQIITVNTLGAFFNASYNNMPLTTDRGRINGGTPAAQVFIVLHELAHSAGVIQNDAGHQNVVDANDKTIEKNCSQTVKAGGK
jgi:RHS repeat-associated protein